MKQNIHPTYHKNAKVTCSCGTNFEVGSTKTEIHMEVCSNCHPFYTGTTKFIDTAGRVDKFRAKMDKAKEYQAKTAPTKKDSK